MDNPFTLKPEEYKRDLNIMQHYIEDSAFYLHKRTGKDLQTCEEFVKGAIAKGGVLETVDPPVLSLTKHTPANREKEVIPFSKYINDVIETNRIISPTMAVYLGPEEVESLSSKFIKRNIAKRYTSKEEMFEADKNGNEWLANFKDNEQTSFKISNNSLSGAQASTGTILNNKSAHSTLTSTCRTATSNGNASNEKFLFGNRHYWSPDIVKNNIVNIIRRSDYTKIKEALELYGIRHPTIDETFECIKYSTDLYWKNPEQDKDIYEFVKTLTDLERTAFVYSGDLYHLAKYNDSVVREFLKKLSTKASEPIDNPDDYISVMDSDLKAFISLLCSKELNGESIKVLKKENPLGYGILGATTKRVIEILKEYTPLIHAFWRIEAIPASIAHIRDSIRRGVVTSDTDSTIFSVQDWTTWYVGKLDFSEESLAISYAVVYLTTQNIIHILAKVSANMGVREENIHMLSMKNEFAFPVFALTGMAKHYYAYISAREGNVFKELETEVKGVYLKDANVPQYIRKEFQDTINWVMDKVMTEGSFSIEELLKKIALLEKDIYKSVKKGSSFFLSRGQIKDSSSYKNPIVSPYTHYLLWKEVFADKYGESPEPPYPAIKVPLALKNKTDLQEWFDSIEDRDIAAKLENWLVTNKKQNITSILVPRTIVESNGIPDEIIKAMNVRKLIFTTMKAFYIMLESFNYYLINDNLTKLVSDFVEVEEEDSKNV